VSLSVGKRFVGKVAPSVHVLGLIAALLTACASAPAASAPPAPVPSTAASGADAAPALRDIPSEPETAVSRLARTLDDFDAANNDEELVAALHAVHGMVDGGTPIDPAVADALFRCFSRFRVSEAKHIGVVKGLHDALLAVRSPSYGAGCVEKLEAPVVNPSSTDEVRDQIQFWQLTCLQLEKELRYAPAARTVVKLVLTPNKRDLFSTASVALLAMAEQAEPLLISALDGSDAELARLAALWPNKSHVLPIAEALGRLGRAPGRSAALAALAVADTDTNRAGLAQTLFRYPTDPRIVPAFEGAYQKIPDGTDDALLGGNLHVPLVAAAASLYDRGLTRRANLRGADDVLAQAAMTLRARGM
jgi:hypothetical protein